VQPRGIRSYGPAFERVAREQPNLACLIYLTDVVSFYPERLPTSPTLWAIATPNRQAPRVQTMYVDVTGS
jgi:predicted metal-dependent peptidase